MSTVTKKELVERIARDDTTQKELFHTAIMQ